MTTLWDRADRAARLYALAPAAFGGLWLRGRPSPARDALLGRLGAIAGPRIHPAVETEALEGGIDPLASLSEGGLSRRRGLLADHACLHLSGAERCPPGLAASLGRHLDAGTHAFLLLDEGSDDEAPPTALLDRMGLFAATDGIPRAEITGAAWDLAPARALFPHVTLAEADLAELTHTAAALGIASLRPPRFAAAAARGLAALAGRTEVQATDLEGAATLAFAHRASPPSEAEEAPGETPPTPGESGDGPDDAPTNAAEDRLVQSTHADLPPDLLSRLVAARAARNADGQGAGAKRMGNRRGRPRPPRPGALTGDARLDLPATLRAAIPWQRLRGSPPGGAVRFRADDIRVRRAETRSDRLLVFAVDASGSAAAARLNEAKGAIEALLTQAYSNRDHVALVVFRGHGAECVLPPTRSLVRARKRLADLPGGGGTPLAAGLQVVGETIAAGRRAGFSPAVILLTDGRANIDLAGHADRDTAKSDARRAGRNLAASGCAGIVIDTGRRPSADLRTLATETGFGYSPLPLAGLGASLGEVLSP